VSDGGTCHQGCNLGEFKCKAHGYITHSVQLTSKFEFQTTTPNLQWKTTATSRNVRAASPVCVVCVCVVLCWSSYVRVNICQTSLQSPWKHGIQSKSLVNLRSALQGLTNPWELLSVLSFCSTLVACSTGRAIRVHPLRREQRQLLKRSQSAAGSLGSCSIRNTPAPTGFIPLRREQRGFGVTDRASRTGSKAMSRVSAAPFRSPLCLTIPPYLESLRQ